MKRLALSLALSLAALPVALTLSGCSADFGTVTAESDTTQIPIGTIKGSAYGGQQPIVNQDIYLFAVGTGTYGGSSVSLLSNTGNVDNFGRSYVVTDSNGNFNITGDYTCTYSPTAPQVLYLYGINGDPGGGNNVNAGLMAVLGACPSNGTFAGHISFVYMNEVSTVAAAYSLAGYASDATDISLGGAGGSSSNPPTFLAEQGLMNAAANANQLYKIDGTGSQTKAANTHTPGSTSKNTGTVPAAMINSIANSLAACINSAAPFTPCSMLFGDLPVGPSNAQPTDTATAAIYIAKHPATNVAQIFALAGNNPVFSPTLTTAPYDFTVAISYTAQFLQYPVDVAIDAAGNAWVTSSAGNKLIKLTSTGIGTSYTEVNPNYISIDTAGNSTNQQQTTGDVFTTSPYSYTGGSGSSVQCFGFFDSGSADCLYELASGSSTPVASYLDGQYTLVNSADIVNDGSYNDAGFNYIADLGGNSGSGELVTADPITPATGENADTDMYTQDSGWTYLAVASPQGFLFATDPSTGNICRTDADTGVPNGPGAPYDQCFLKTVTSPQKIAIDSLGNAWIPDMSKSNLYRVLGTSPTRITLSPTSGYSGGGLNAPFGVAIDGGGTAWVTNTGQITFGDGASCTGCSISAFSTNTGSTGTAITPATVGTSGSSYYNPSGGYTSGNESTSEGYYNLAIDGSGDIWIANSSLDTVTEIIGVAAPTVTPLSYAVLNGTLGQKP